MNDVYFMSLLDLSDRIRTGQMRAQAVVEQMLDRIARVDRELNSYVRVDGDEAMAAARRADTEIGAGFWRGPLHGVPLAVKDLLHMAGKKSAAGTVVFKDFVADCDATAVRKLKDAGAVILGSLRMTEGAGLEHHPDLTRPINPWNSSAWAGVSSSGSGVATAAGLCFGALGTDTGGSIRMPSAACGLSGIKPTWGRVSRHGLFALAESFDHIGPMARSAGDAAAILQVIAGADPDDPTASGEPVPDYLGQSSPNLTGLTIGIDRDYATSHVDKDVAAGIENAVGVFAALGARICTVKFPSIDTLLSELMPQMSCEVAAAHHGFYPEQAALYGKRLAGTIEGASAFSGTEVARAATSRTRFAAQVQNVFRDIDLLIIPSMPVPPPRHDEVESNLDNWDWLTKNLMRFTFPFNASGSPTLSMPSGFTEQGLPVSVQLVAKHFREDVLVAAGRAFQTRTAFHARHPVVATD
jgi:amidase